MHHSFYHCGPNMDISYVLFLYIFKKFCCILECYLPTGITQNTKNVHRKVIKLRKQTHGEVYSIQHYVNKVCQLLATGRWVSQISSINKTDHNDIHVTEILWKVHNVVSSTPRHEGDWYSQLWWWYTLIAQVVVNPTSTIRSLWPQYGYIVCSIFIYILKTHPGTLGNTVQ
jgi:hypothetical protein